VPNGAKRGNGTMPDGLIRPIPVAVLPTTEFGGADVKSSTVGSVDAGPDIEI
jgi:hypothetical protein